VSLVLAVALLAPGAPVAGDTLTDKAIAAYAAKPFDKRAKAFKHEVLGVHHGARVLVDFPCSDLCPDATVRLIHYDAAPGPDCDRIGGVTQSRMVPRGPGVGSQAFCVPAVLARKGS
jgi:hypothetical protein